LQSSINNQGEIKMNDRQKLIKLIEDYLHKQITVKNFTDHYTLFFHLEMDDDGSMAGEEKEQFRELADIADRYSPYEGELIKYKSVYFSEEDVYRTAKKVYETLVDF